MTDLQEQRLAELLIRRNYLYALFRLLFGDKPKPEVMERLFAPETAECLEALRNVYAEEVLAKEAEHTIGIDNRDMVECVDEMLACLRAHEADWQTPAFIEGLTSDYMALFQTPGTGYVHMWESPYIHHDNMLFQQSTMDVRNYYHAAGFKLEAEHKWPDDHIAALLAFMSRIGLEAFAAFEAEDDAKVKEQLELSAGFVKKHLANWIDELASDIILKDSRALYAAFAGCLVAFVRADAVLTAQAAAVL